MLLLEETPRASRLGSPSRVVVLALAAFVAQSACGSEDGKKKVGPQYSGGGESSGGEATKGDASGATGLGGQGDGNPTGDAGSPSAVTAGAGGAAGVAGAAGSECPKGTADCDANPDDCETDATLLTSCGACGVTCSDKN